MPLTDGTRLSAYEIVASIGSGGLGEVYRTRHGRLGRDVAIKVLPSGSSSDARSLYDITPDGRFRVNLADRSESSPINLDVNWAAGLRQ